MDVSSHEEYAAHMEAERLRWERAAVGWEERARDARRKLEGVKQDECKWVGQVSHLRADLKEVEAERDSLKLQLGEAREALAAIRNCCVLDVRNDPSVMSLESIAKRGLKQSGGEVVVKR